MQKKIERAILSVFDKRGIVDVAKSLTKLGVEILSTGGTAKALRNEEINVVDVSDYTGFPEGLDGRVKTLHPMVHGGLLYIRGNSTHEEWTLSLSIKPIDLVIVNLYPFEQTVAKPGVTDAEAIEQIDIGGPAMLRSAAKNYDSVTVVTDPNDYGRVLQVIRSQEGYTYLGLRRELAYKVFKMTAAYDAQIATYFVERALKKGEW